MIVCVLLANPCPPVESGLPDRTAQPPAHHISSTAGRRSLLVHVPTPSEPRFVLSSAAPLPQEEPCDGAAAAATAAAAAAAHAYEWRELEPGVYSVGGAALAAALAAPPPPSAAAPDGGASTGSSSECSGPVWDSVRRHAWEGAEIERLVRYERDDALIESQRPLSAAALESDRGGGGGGDEVGSSSNNPVLRAAAARLLAALEHAVRVRCASTRPAGADDCAAALAACDAAAAAAAATAAATQGCSQPPVPPLLPPAPVLILFSGGNDSTLMAALADRCLPPGVPIDLANVCFDAGGSPDRLAARDSLVELSEASPTRRLFRLIEVDASLGDVDAARARLLALLAPAGTVMDLNIGGPFWLAARGEGRVVTAGDVRAERAAAAAAAAAAGANGGSDGVAAAAAAAGTQQKKKDKKKKSKWKPRPADQQQQQQQEQEEQQEQRQEVEAAAAKQEQPQQQPEQRQSEQQQPEQQQPEQQQPEQQQQQPEPAPAPAPRAPARLARSLARVVLLGNGADEQAAGYGRCLTAFRTAGWRGVSEEVAGDMRRIWLRNLGRDDRLVADHAREARHPYLDEDVVAALLETPVAALLDPSPGAPPGERKSKG